MTNYKFSRKKIAQALVNCFERALPDTTNQMITDLLAVKKPKEKKDIGIMVSECCHASFFDREDWGDQCCKCGDMCQVISIPTPKKPKEKCKNCELVSGGNILVDTIDATGDVICSACKRIVGPRHIPKKPKESGWTNTSDITEEGYNPQPSSEKKSSCCDALVQTVKLCTKCGNTQESETIQDKAIKRAKGTPWGALWLSSDITPSSEECECGGYVCPNCGDGYKNYEKYQKHLKTHAIPSKPRIDYTKSHEFELEQSGETLDCVCGLTRKNPIHPKKKFDEKEFMRLAKACQETSKPRIEPVVWLKGMTQTSKNAMYELKIDQIITLLNSEKK